MRAQRGQKSGTWKRWQWCSLDRAPEMNGPKIVVVQGFDPIKIAKCWAFGSGRAGTGALDSPASIKKPATISASARRSLPNLICTPRKYSPIKIFFLGIVIPALFMASSISLARSGTSSVPKATHSSVIGRVENGVSSEVNFTFCSAVRRRGLRLASSLVRSMRSPSTILLASAACCSARAAPSWALAARSFAPARFSSALPARSTASPADFLASPASFETCYFFLPLEVL
jgi:hypothetical protein